jgi:hypothetical protein
MSTYQLTQNQQINLDNFIHNQLSSFIDEELCSDYLITDDLLDNDKFDEINNIKSAALEYIKNKI